MKKNKTVYKVVYCSRHYRDYSVTINYFSTNASRGNETPDFMKLEYKLGEVTKPRVGKLFVFKDLKAAKTWRTNMGGSYDYQILKGKANGISETGIFSIPGVRHFKLDSINKFWANKSVNGFNNRWRLPSKTLFSDDFTPTEAIHG